MATLHPFGDWAETARANGYLPVPMQGKVPAIKNWNSRPMGGRAIRNLIARNPKVKQANLGVRTGKLVAIDIDVGNAIDAARIAYAAEGMLGFTRFKRVGKHPRIMLFYRSDGVTKSRKVGSVEVLGENKVAVVMGTHPETDKPYSWPEECILDCDFSGIPVVKESELDRFMGWAEHFQRNSTAIHEIVRSLTAIASSASVKPSPHKSASVTIASKGERNNTLFRTLKNTSGSVRLKATLLARAHRINNTYNPPMDDEEVKRVVDSIWKYREGGRLFAPGSQSILLPFGKNEILDMKGCADAVYLFVMLKATREDASFTIPQKATAKRLAWGSNRLKKAIDDLVAKGWLMPLHSHAKRQFCAARRYAYGRF